MARNPYLFHCHGKISVAFTYSRCSFIILGRIVSKCGSAQSRAIGLSNATLQLAIWKDYYALLLPLERHWRSNCAAIGLLSSWTIEAAPRDFGHICLIFFMYSVSFCEVIETAQDSRAIVSFMESVAAKAQSGS